MIIINTNKGIGRIGTRRKYYFFLHLSYDLSKSNLKDASSTRLIKRLTRLTEQSVLPQKGRRHLVKHCAQNRETNMSPESNLKWSLQGAMLSRTFP